MLHAERHAICQRVETAKIHRVTDRHEFLETKPAIKILVFRQQAQKVTLRLGEAWCDQDAHFVQNLRVGTLRGFDRLRAKDLLGQIAKFIEAL